MTTQSPLTTMIRALWVTAGRPASRTIARRRNGEITHTTVSTVLTGKNMARWSSVVQVVQALGGNPEQFRHAWELEWDAHETRRHTNAGRSRVRVVQGLVVRPGDTLLLTVPEVPDGEEEMRTFEEAMAGQFPGVDIKLIYGVQAAVINGQEEAA